MFNTFNNIITENGLNFEKVEFNYPHNEYAGKTTAEFIAEELKLRTEAEAADEANHQLMEEMIEKIENLDLSEKIKDVLKQHAKIVFETNYASMYLSDEEMDLIE